MRAGTLIVGAVEGEPARTSRKQFVAAAGDAEQLEEIMLQVVGLVRLRSG